MSFDMADYFHISPFTFDNVEYFEFNYQYEKAMIKRREENSQTPNGGVDLASMLNGG
jgi:hypothetical protein